MALSEQEKQILDYAKANGKSLVEAKAAIHKYRTSKQAKQQLEAEQKEQDRGFLEKAGDVSKKILEFTGGSKVSEALGTQIARGGLGESVQEFAVGKQLSPEEEALVAEGPTGKEIAGDVVRTGAMFFPVGRIAGAVGKGLSKIGLGSKAATIGGEIAAGTSVGATADIGASVAEGQEAQLGLGTILGAGIPAASPVAGAISRAVGRGTGTAAAEISGALTGTSAETLEQAFFASKAGGKQLDSFTEALRGKVTPEALVDNFQTNISKVSSRRQELFKNTLEELKDQTVPTKLAKDSFAEQLAAAGISVTDEGLDFSKSKLRTVPSAQSKITTAFQEVSNLPPSSSILEVDTTRQALKALQLAGDDPSANLANKLIDDATRSVRSAGEQVTGYGQMLDNFAETSQFLDELQRGLSSGDRSTIDQTYRRMATSLKTNNEQRMALVRELDAATDGAILSEISGQQLSEIMPRGIFRQIAAGIAGGAAISGGISPTLLPALVFASPKVTGEFVRALGISSAKADVMIESINQARNTLIKAGAITGTGVENTSDFEEEINAKELQ